MEERRRGWPRRQQERGLTIAPCVPCCRWWCLAQLSSLTTLRTLGLGTETMELRDVVGAAAQLPLLARLDVRCALARKQQQERQQEQQQQRQEQEREEEEGREGPVRAGLEPAAAWAKLNRCVAVGSEQGSLSSLLPGTVPHPRPSAINTRLALRDALHSTAGCSRWAWPPRPRSCRSASCAR